jgi:hypothetical protein
LGLNGLQVNEPTETLTVDIYSKRWKLPKFNVEKARKFIVVQYIIRLVVNLQSQEGKRVTHMYKEMGKRQ